MRIYEELFIIDPAATDEEVDAIVRQMEDLVKETGGEVEKVDRWGIRRLAYRINKRDEGRYILMQFKANSKAIREIERRLRVHESVLKYLTVRIDEKLKWIEKRKKVREKRAQRKPAVGPGHAGPGPRVPGEPSPVAPGAPVPEAPEAAGGGNEE